jgi:hypothetical protein
MKKELNAGSLGKFKLVQTKLFTMNYPLQGQSSFIPVHFDKEYTSMCMMTLHSALIEFRFRSLPKSKKGNAKLG